MFSSPLKKVLAILILAFLALYIDLPKKIPVKFSAGGMNINKNLVRGDINITTERLTIKKNFDLVLGLDLAGGSHLVFEADTSKLSLDRKKEAIDSVRDVIERRVNLFGVTEPTVQTSSFAGSQRIIVELPGIKDVGGAISVIGKTAQLTFAELGDENDQGIFPTELTGANLESARVEYDQNTSKPVVGIKFDEEGAKKFEDLTEKNVGKPLAIILDTEIVSAPIVQEKISGGSAVISGNFTIEGAKNLAIQLNAGALPVSIKLVEERTVGATLGQDSVQRSIRAGCAGLLMVLLFMVLIYGKMGFIADIALIIFGLMTLALYKIIPVTLTLPGIAGFLLSVGMAVDSNILIFERFKEEIQRRPFGDALEVSFGRAWDSIRDANIATLFTAFVLANPFDWKFLHTSGPVRGFAITLALGIGISLFTGIVVSRNLLRVLIRESEGV
ncbi:protein-export membrane protein SecD [Candidatus Woesebacteria bacterium RIFCSPLOWO2_01_FULL_39_23]|uniref:Protein translocase subunit SecD n=1 Tax=Candidatus Woesebacteria bacterium RIFCSPHIGHO2_01_FULL_40_22 TaxID=1802499 RepID=A0A1F7YN08_9BACT|nr:MAG: protein-export membrane protein SecD [Candidatus Woesebacteria bacterium RBG_16_40_11]OGM27925.1 MAG: protein-export membrane protein SecD [Candidatus Woesebacteria bacterium RIFCSPHIGHO2_01_FULL_40_22]OGM37529.1 MAG: protein-export membrane protein SecD [Candidatus Woesebacteria bacterium RIFCSPHIGHO2_12_FULL_38_9]OGM61681.1 MAG: protein-export membrane protein SecD [Candidatus Woesebacteria bacterium RIFCSPLOWO2_01_FULL_39_23]